MTPDEQAKIDLRARIEESKARISDPHNDILKTFDVGRMLHRSEAAVLKMRKAGQIPSYALPKKLHPSQRGLYWSKSAILRWISETMGAA